MIRTMTHPILANNSQNNTTVRLRLLALAAPLTFAAMAMGQWEVLRLHPDTGVVNSTTTGGDGNFVVGTTNDGLVSRAVVWNTSTGEMTDLTPSDSADAIIRGAGGGQFVGQSLSTTSISTRPLLWLDGGTTVIDLLPADALDGTLIATDGTTQGGAVIGSDGLSRASMWNGTPESWVDLHPASALFSSVNAVKGMQQVGRASDGSFDHAALWRSTPESWVDLNPAGALISMATGLSEDQQVGWALLGGVRAGYWTGTADSWRLLHPDGAIASLALAVHDGIQVGQVVLDTSQAALWEGTPESWFNLHDLLPDTFESSRATGVWRTDDGVVHVSGIAFNSVEQRDEAVVWIRTDAAECPADLDGDGELTIFDFLEFQNLFAAMDPRADFDGDGEFTLFDFLEFQNEFAAGCE